VIWSGPPRKRRRSVGTRTTPQHKHEIIALEAFRVIVGTPVGFTPLVDLYVTIVLEGLLLRGLTG
jgi:hypothetical protein